MHIIKRRERSPERPTLSCESTTIDAQLNNGAQHLRLCNVYFMPLLYVLFDCTRILQTRFYLHHKGHVAARRSTINWRNRVVHCPTVQITDTIMLGADR
jgi:hypothetical protein